MPFHYTTNPTKIPKTNSYSLAHSQIKGSRKKKRRERENCNIQFQLKKMLLVEVIDSLEVLKWQILIELGQVKQTGHHQLVLKTGKSYWLKECRKSFNSMCHLEKLGFRRQNLRYWIAIDTAEIYWKPKALFLALETNISFYNKPCIRPNLHKRGI